MPIFHVRLFGDNPRTSCPLEADDEVAARLAYRAVVAGLKCDDDAISVDELPPASSEYKAAQTAITLREAENRIKELLQAKPQTASERAHWAAELLPEVKAGNAEQYHHRIARMATNIVHDIDARLMPSTTVTTRNDCIRLLQIIMGLDGEREPSQRFGDEASRHQKAPKGRTVEQVIADAEKHLERNPWPGHNAFAKLLNCSSATLTKACKRSPMLLKAKTEHETRSKSVSAKSGRGMEQVEVASSEPGDEDLNELLSGILANCTTDEERERVRRMPRHEAAMIAGIAFTDADTGKSRRTLNRQ